MLIFDCGAKPSRSFICPPTASIQVLSAEAYSKNGVNILGVVFDELQTQLNRKLLDVMIMDPGDLRTQPLFFLITMASIRCPGG